MAKGLPTHLQRANVNATLASVKAQELKDANKERLALRKFSWEKKEEAKEPPK